MILKSANHYYIYENKSKYLFSVHPMINLFYLLHDKEMDFILKAAELQYGEFYSMDEIQIFYQQYLFLKENAFFRDDPIEANTFHVGKHNIEDCLSSIPQIIFEVTEKCNLNCTYCGYGEHYSGYEQRKNRDLKFITAKKTIDYFVEKWKIYKKDNISKKTIISFYGGEPLLNFKLIQKIVSYCESFGFKSDFFMFSMTTNGFLLEQYLDFLIDKNFKILVSLDGDRNNNDYRKMKNGQSSFDTIFTSLMNIKLKNETFFNKNIEFNAVIHKKNSLSEVTSFFKKNFDKTPSISSLSTDNIAPSKEKKFKDIYKFPFDDLMRGDLNEYSEAEVLKYDIFSFFRKNCKQYFMHIAELYKAERKPRIMPTATCIPFNRRMYVTVNGIILPCERVGDRPVLGYVDEQKGMVLDVGAIASDCNQKNLSFENDCKICYNRYSCGICSFKYSQKKCDEFMNIDSFRGAMSFNLSMIEKFPNILSYIKKITIS